MPEMNKNPIKARFIIVSPKSCPKFDWFLFDEGECKYIIVNNNGAHWVNNIKDNVICLKKQQIKDAVAYLLLNCYFTVRPKIFLSSS